MITSNVIHRTLQIKCGIYTGTACVVDRDEKQYLVTARHVVNGINPRDKIEISFEQQWHPIEIEVVGLGEGEIDVAVLAGSVQLAPTHLLEASLAGMAYGQSVYFLGFPFGWSGGGEDINGGRPLPFVKAGIVSTLYSNERTALFYIDGYGNRGFSGGPVVFVPNNRSPSETTPYKLAGIVANYPIPLESRRPIVNKKNEELDTYFVENSGLVAAVNIGRVTDIIDSNPIGFKLHIN